MDAEIDYGNETGWHNTENPEGFLYIHNSIKDKQMDIQNTTPKEAQKIKK